MSEIKLVNLQESALLQNFSLQCRNNALDVTPEEGEWFIKGLLSGITEHLNIVKDKSSPRIIAISDLKGNMIAAAVIQYIAGEESETAQGSWSYTWAFTEEDLPHQEDGSLDGVKYQITESPVIQTINRVSYDLARISFTSPTFVSQMACYVFNILVDTLDQNAPTIEGDKWGIDMPGYFMATVAIEDGKKYFAMEPQAELKVRIKSDIESEK